jgi:hypothetical protein
VPTNTVAEFPPFDTGQFDGAEFHMSGGDAQLVAHVAGADDVVVTFKRIRWHEFTALYNCSPEQVQGAYFKLAEVDPSPTLLSYVAADKASAKAYKELHRFRVFLDEHGCHEVYSQSADISVRKALRSGEVA